MRNLTPSRSGVFLVDQTVPTTFPKNIFAILHRCRGGPPWPPLQRPKLDLREHLSGLAYITRRRCDDRARTDVDLFTLLNRAPHVVLADKLNCLCAITRGWRRLDFSRWWWWWRRGRCIHTARFSFNNRRWQRRRFQTFAGEESIHDRCDLLSIDLTACDYRLLH